MTDEKSEYQKQLEEVTYINSTFGRISEQQAIEGIKRILEDQNIKPMTIREGLIPYRMYGEGDDRYYIYVDRDGVRYRKRYRLNSSDVFDFEPIDKEEKKTMPNYTTSQPTDYTFYRMHTTIRPDGDKIIQPIAAMDDDHLRATIYQIFEKLRIAMGGAGTNFQNLDPLSQQILGKLQKEVAKQSADAIPSLLAYLNAYLSEAVFIRNMVDLIPEYQSVIGRSARLPFFLVDESNLVNPVNDPLQLKYDPNVNRQNMKDAKAE